MCPLNIHLVKPIPHIHSVLHSDSVNYQFLFHAVNTVQCCEECSNRRKPFILLQFLLNLPYTSWNNWEISILYEHLPCHVNILCNVEHRVTRRKYGRLTIFKHEWEYWTIKYKHSHLGRITRNIDSTHSYVVLWICFPEGIRDQLWTIFPI